ncbi:MAG: alpha/beta hydrolase [Proteobacteria bacterium]|nr:alpha/beta hydrolase [Pseudomonadota bacterium]HQR03875.1 alpha/beta hydrolase [Rhodocyclaceae bacterium]
MTGPVSREFHSRGLALRYADWGGDTRPPLILLHGGLDHSRGWDELARALRASHHVVAPDLRGHGDSAWSPDGDYSFAAYISDLAAFMHHWKRGPVSIVAHSQGANIALRYAGIFPETVARLVAIEGIPPPIEILQRQVAERSGERMQAWLEERKKILPRHATTAARTRAWIEQMRRLEGRRARPYASQQEMAERFLEDKEKRLDRAQAERIVHHGSRPTEDGRWVWKFDPQLNVQIPDEWQPEQLQQVWRNITCPVMMVMGRESWGYDADMESRLTPHFRSLQVATLAAAGHWCHLNQPEAFLELLRGFL